MKVERPKLKCRFLKKRGFNGTFNPREPVTIHNPLPQHKWPFRFNTPVYFLDRHNNICAGRVSWYHPARQLDHSCIITPGCPFFRVVTEWGTRRAKVGPIEYQWETIAPFEQAETACDVFPMTKAGFRAALVKIADYCEEYAREESRRSAQHSKNSIDFMNTSQAYRRKAKGIK